jgi:hypothetical protein
MEFDDPINYGLMQAGGALLTPRARGGGLGAAFGAFGNTVSRERQNQIDADLKRLLIESRKRELVVKPQQKFIPLSNGLIFDTEKGEFLQGPQKESPEKIPPDVALVHAAYPDPNDPRRAQALQKIAQRKGEHSPMLPQFQAIPGATGIQPFDARTGTLGPEQGTRPLNTADVKKTNPVLPPHLSKKLMQLEEQNDANEMAIDALNAADLVNDSNTYSGYFAGERATLRSNLPGKSPQADSTIEYRNIIDTQAVQSLKLLFGGQPTEGERKVLLELQASVDKTPEQRKPILQRARELAKKRIEANNRLAEGIRGGKFGGAAGEDAPAPARKFTVIRRN